MNDLIEYFHKLLLNSDEILEYLENRNVSINEVKKFKLGKFPNNIKNVLKYADTKFLADSLILYSTFNGIKSEFSRNKLIIPIYDVDGNPVGISGRVLVDDKTIKKFGMKKYYNSAYNKRLHLYGLNWSKEHIRNKGEAIVVEGYFDLISAFRAGMKNVVAVCGTMLSNGQLNLLARYTKNINLLYDNDTGGKRAADGAMKRQNKNRINVKILKIEKFNDLDELIRSGEDINKYILR